MVCINSAITKTGIVATIGSSKTAFIYIKIAPKVYEVKYEVTTVTRKIN